MYKKTFKFRHIKSLTTNLSHYYKTQLLKYYTNRYTTFACKPHKHARENLRQTRRKPARKPTKTKTKNHIRLRPFYSENQIGNRAAMRNCVDVESALTRVFNCCAFPIVQAFRKTPKQEATIDLFDNNNNNYDNDVDFCAAIEFSCDPIGEIMLK